MMRKIFVSLCVLLLTACGSSAGGNSNASGSTGAWVIDSMVDDFGDKIEGSNILKTEGINASFSNTATTDGDLSVVLFDTIQTDDSFISQHIVVLRLLEYNDTPATYLSSSKFSVKIKLNDGTVLELNPYAKAPNSDLYFGYTDFDGDRLHYLLKDGENIKFAITIDSSKYNFEIDGKGLKEICDSQEISSLEQTATTAFEEKSTYPNSDCPTVFFATGKGSVKYYPYDYSSDLRYQNITAEYYHEFSSYEEASSAANSFSQYLEYLYGKPEFIPDKVESAPGKTYGRNAYTDGKGNKIAVSASSAGRVYIYFIE